jgi:hypothetical protein
MNSIRGLGEAGSTLITDTTACTGRWFAIQIVTDTAFTTLTDPTMSIVGALAGLSFSAGTIIFGAFSAITLASGSVLAYKLPA